MIKNILFSTLKTKL